MISLLLSLTFMLEPSTKVVEPYLAVTPKGGYYVLANPFGHDLSVAFTCGKKYKTIYFELKPDEAYAFSIVDEYGKPVSTCRIGTFYVIDTGEQ